MAKQTIPSAASQDPAQDTSTKTTLKSQFIFWVFALIIHVNTTNYINGHKTAVV